MNSMIKQEKVKKVYEDTRNVHYCDLCRDEICRSDVDIKCRLDGYNYGSDGVWNRELFFDVCDKCFVKKVVPALKKIGLKPMIEDYDDGNYEYEECKDEELEDFIK